MSVNLAYSLVGHQSPTCYPLFSVLNNCFLQVSFCIIQRTLNLKKTTTDEAHFFEVEYCVNMSPRQNVWNDNIKFNSTKVTRTCHDGIVVRSPNHPLSTCFLQICHFSNVFREQHLFSAILINKCLLCITCKVAIVTSQFYSSLAIDNLHRSLKSSLVASFYWLYSLIHFISILARNILI